MECERRREKAYDHETDWMIIWMMAMGCWLGFYAVQVAGFEGWYQGLDAIGGILMSCGFGLLTLALRMKKKRCVMKHGAER